MTFKDSFINQEERDCMTPQEPKLIGYDYKGEEVYDYESRIIFDGHIVREGDERDFLLTMGGDAID